MKLPDFLVEKDGEISLAGHRIGLDVILMLYTDGVPVELISAEYPFVALSQLHKVIAFYLDNREDVDAYLKAHEERLAKMRREGLKAPSMVGCRNVLGKPNDFTRRAVQWKANGSSGRTMTWAGRTMPRFPKTFLHPRWLNCGGGSKREERRGHPDWASAHDRILVSLDEATLPGHLADPLAAGKHSPGIILIPKRRASFPIVLEFPEAVAFGTSADEWTDTIRYAEI